MRKNFFSDIQSLSSGVTSQEEEAVVRQHAEKTGEAVLSRVEAADSLNALHDLLAEFQDSIQRIEDQLGPNAGVSVRYQGLVKGAQAARNKQASLETESSKSMPGPSA